MAIKVTNRQAISILRKSMQYASNEMILAYDKAIWALKEMDKIEEEKAKAEKRGVADEV